jgi:hypothetical protein
MLRNGVYHYIPSRLTGTNINIFPVNQPEILHDMYEVRTCSTKVWREVAQNLKAADILTMLCCEATCKFDTCVHINHKSEGKYKRKHLPAAGNTFILVHEETEK